MTENICVRCYNRQPCPRHGTYTGLAVDKTIGASKAVAHGTVVATKATGKTLAKPFVTTAQVVKGVRVARRLRKEMVETLLAEQVVAEPEPETPRVKRVRASRKAQSPTDIIDAEVVEEQVG